MFMRCESADQIDVRSEATPNRADLAGRWSGFQPYHWRDQLSIKSEDTVTKCCELQYLNQSSSLESAWRRCLAKYATGYKYLGQHFFITIMIIKFKFSHQEKGRSVFHVFRRSLFLIHARAIFVCIPMIPTLCDE